MDISKKYIVDESGKPVEVIIPYEQFKKIEEILGLDLEPKVKEHLRQARIDREINPEGCYVDLNEL